MESRPSRLYLIEVGYQTVAIVPGKNTIEAINKYLTRNGFTNIREYFCSHLMTNIITIDTEMSNINRYYFALTSAKPSGVVILSISLQQAKSCDDIFDRVNFMYINSPLVMKPTIEEARNCIGFDKTPMYVLRKFCI